MKNKAAITSFILTITLILLDTLSGIGITLGINKGLIDVQLARTAVEDYVLTTENWPVPYEYQIYVYSIYGIAILVAIIWLTALVLGIIGFRSSVFAKTSLIILLLPFALALSVFAIGIFVAIAMVTGFLSYPDKERRDNTWY